MCKPSKKNVENIVKLKADIIKIPSHIREEKRILKIIKKLENLIKLIDGKVECTVLNEKIVHIQDDLKIISDSVMKTHFQSCISQAIKNKDKVFIEAQLKKLTLKS